MHRVCQIFSPRLSCNFNWRLMKSSQKPGQQSMVLFFETFQMYWKYKNHQNKNKWFFEKIMGSFFSSCSLKCAAILKGIPCIFIKLQLRQYALKGEFRVFVTKLSGFEKMIWSPPNVFQVQNKAIISTIHVYL